MRYNSEDIEMLVESLKIEEVVGEFVELHKAGANYKGLCPFHADNTPSFMVSPSKNICKCFVCGAGGNPLTFYARYKKISFVEAIEELSNKYKISIKAIGKNNKEQKNNENYYKIMKDAHEFFKNAIFSNSGREALEYLSKREVSPKIIKENGLGFAPNKWNELNDYLVNKGYKAKELLELGLIKEREGNLYDAFRNRIIFPIYSIHGEVIAFGGRTLTNDNDTPKYINSPDTPIFKKGRNLYGLERSSIIKKKNYAMLMEGYMDVLSAYLYGFNVTLAPLGTALTEEQAGMLKRYTQNIILCFDSDNPGQMATERAGHILKRAGFNIRVLELEGAKDPDEYLKRFGKEKFLECVKNSVEIFDFLFKYYSKEYDLTNIISKQNFVNRFKDFFNCVDTELEKFLYIDKLSTQIGIDKSVLKETLIDNNTKKSRKFENDIVNIDKQKEKGVISRVERDTLFICLARKEYFEYFKDKQIRGSLTTKVFNYLEGNSEEVKIIASELPKKIELNETELKEWKLVICSLIEDYTDERKIQELLIETFLSWFKQEIETSYMKAQTLDLLSGLKLAQNIKKIEAELEEARNFMEIVEIYEKFKQLLNL